MLFVKWLIIIATLGLMFGMTALAAIYTRTHSDDEEVLRFTPLFVLIFGTLPVIVYSVIVITNLDVFDIPLLSNFSLAFLVLCPFAIGLALLRSKLQILYSRFWRNLTGSR